ncbi:MBOAT family protein [Massilicoli timonensis]|uniref:MBOAT family protein n=1 Tax=Massilicoli timonensis TaxID=2015901 RepID=A0ABT1SI32_9FIRM|nr:MBOAT family O-acyltransferase [Massilicoli timonensis]MCQ5120860.1 MBOAT family protein [Massilicoli timonensis]
MSFNSIFFLFSALPLFYALYLLTPPKGKRYMLLVISFAAYFWVEPLFSILLLMLACYLYLLNLRMQQVRQYKKLAICMELIGIVLFLLLYFKYYGFLLSGISALTSFDFTLRLLIAPAGISFISFSLISYAIDLYQGKLQKQPKLGDFLLYVFYFPKIIMGPIMRYPDFEAQLKPLRISIAATHEGLCRFVIGLAKKVILANTFAFLFEQISANAALSMLSAWIGAFAFTFQIYFDFSGYSDMAIGLSLLLGIRMPENFHYPYMANSIKDFWKRWHITLSTWFKDYVYIPLGGSRCKLPRVILNTFIVWSLTGLWHGASWNFVLWGIYYFVLLMLERYVLGGFLRKCPQTLRILLTFLLVAIGWMLFAFPDLAQMSDYLKAMFGANGLIDEQSFWYFKNHLFYFLCAVIASTPLFHQIYLRTKAALRLPLHDLMILGLFILSICYLVTSTFQPFLYTQF